MLSRKNLAAVLGACGIAIPALLAAGGAAARPGGVWLGPPQGAAVLLILAGVIALTLAVRRRPALAAAGLLLPAGLLVSGAPVAGVRALSGPPLAALALAGLVLAVSQAQWRAPRILFLPLVFAVLVAAAGRTHARVGPRGDEPHYLMVADSLLRDGDLSLEPDYAAGRYVAFHDGPLDPHYRVRGRGGAIYSLHAVGLSVLILPAWALAGYAGVTVLMALLAALAAREVRQWVHELTGREGLAEAAGWVAALSPPLVHYAGLVFTEVPAALLLSFGLRRGRHAALGPGGAVAVGLAAAALPWLNVRYAPLAAVVLLHALWRHPRWRAALSALTPAGVSAGGLLVYHQVLYGFLDPRRVYGRRPELALSTLREGLPGLLLDQEFGLLVYAPVLALALPGFVWLWRRDLRLALAAILAVLAVLLTAGTWHMWRGGFNPPARFLVPVAPLLVVATALAWDRRGMTAGASLLLGWSLWAGLAGAWEPPLVHRDRDDTAPLFRQLSGAREWTGLLPAYVLADPDRHRLAAVWAVALLAALPWRARAATARRVAVAGLGFALAAQSAAAVSRARTDDRDAVRLVGSRALAVPGWRIGPAVGEWSPDALGWGPLYEPHRFPEGAEIGRRLPLRPGRYRLSLIGEGLGSTAAAVALHPDRPGAPARLSEARPVAEGFEAEIEVREGERAVGLSLIGGGAMMLKGLRLSEAQPSGPGPV
ncbi:MAG TPA: hypothetical protein VLL75_15755 [Vicinamibacteria bacterium]|nr:hypothetical protein [Vicinamibacteria bacterium]